MIEFNTESGSTYLIDDSGDPWRACRAVSMHDLRADGEWVELLNKPAVEEGWSVMMVTPVLDPPQFVSAEVTIRRTSCVTKVSYS